MSGELNNRRLFFALWPDPAIRSAIAQRRQALGELSRKRVPDHNLHLTLLFLGNQPADRLDGILKVGEIGRKGPFELILDRFGAFEPARVVWLGGSVPGKAAELVACLEQGMERLELAVRPRPFVPHVTLFRRIPIHHPPLPDAEPLTWPVDNFSLIESLPGQPYQVLRTWSLS